MRDNRPGGEMERLRSRTMTQDALKGFSRFASVSVVLAGGLVLVGWTFDIGILKGFLPRVVPMNPASAVAFIFAGVSLWLLQSGQKERSIGAGNLCAFGVALIGLLVLIGYFLQSDSGIDRLLFREKLNLSREYANQMAPNTAAAFLLAGLGLRMLDVQTGSGYRPAQFSILAVALISLLAVIGYTYRVLSLYGVGAYIPMALTTALTFLLLSAGVLCARPDQGVMAIITSDSAGGATARRLLPAAILVPLALGGLRLWGQKKGFFGAEIGLSLVVVSSMAAFAGLIWWNAKLLYRADGGRKRVERRLTVQYTTARVLAESPTLKEAIPKILQTICETLGWQMGGMWNVDKRSNSLNCVEVWHSPGADTSEFEMLTRQATFPPGVGLPGRVWTSGEPAWIADVVEDTNFPRAPLATKVGLHGGFGFPIRRGNEVLGVMEFFSSKIEQPDANLLQMLAAIGSQIGQFIERKRMEEALQDSEALYHSLVDTLPINILRKDLDGRVSFGNKRYCESMGRPLSELMGKTDFDLFPKTLAEKYVADDRRVIESKEVFEDIEQHQKPNGQKLHVLVLKAPVLDAKGTVVGTQTIFRDVTARKQAEEALEKTAEELARSNRELELFAYVASHDLQEPLRMVASYTQLLARRYQDKLDADANEFIHFAVDGAVRMQRLINDLLAYSRVSSKSKVFEAVDGEKVFGAVIANLKIALHESGATVTHDPFPTLSGDGVQLIQLFQNLIGNALKFRGEKPPQIHIDAELKKEEWAFCVRDNGIGIDPQYFERIFVIFQRLHTRQEYAGTGIGLAVCKKIVERHGGRIWVESEPGKGAAFFFTIPLVQTIAEAPPANFRLKEMV